MSLMFDPVVKESEFGKTTMGEESLEKGKSGCLGGRW